MGRTEKTIAPAAQTPFGLISKYRGELMGFAILWVVYFHSTAHIQFDHLKFITEPIEIFKNLGYGGVDIFMLVSGIGIYQSLKKNSISQFAKNRVKRIIPIWWTYLFLCVVVGAIFFDIHFTFLDVVGRATLYSNWSQVLHHQGNWYVYAIMLFYLVSPVFFHLFEDSRNKTLTCAILVTITLLGSLSFVGSDVKFVYTKQLIAFTRLPVYIVGMYFSANLKEKFMKKSDWVICIAIFLVSTALMIYLLKYQKKLLWPYGLWWYPFLLIAPTLSLLLSKLFSLWERGIRHLLAVLRYLGKASLEILLISNYFFAREKIVEKAHHLHLRYSILIMLGGIAGGVVFHIFMEFMTKLVTNLYRKAKAKKAA